MQCKSLLHFTKWKAFYNVKARIKFAPTDWRRSPGPPSGNSAKSRPKSQERRRKSCKAGIENIGHTKHNIMQHSNKCNKIQQSSKGFTAEGPPPAVDLWVNILSQCIMQYNMISSCSTVFGRLQLAQQRPVHLLPFICIIILLNYIILHPITLSSGGARARPPRLPRALLRRA